MWDSRGNQPRLGVLRSSAGQRRVEQISKGVVVDKPKEVKLTENLFQREP